jgi:hypothetical protein
MEILIRNTDIKKSLYKNLVKILKVLHTCIVFYKIYYI